MQTRVKVNIQSHPDSHGPGNAAFAGGGFAVGAVSAATGALAAKAFSEHSERLAIEERLAEVKRSTAL